MKIRIEGDVKKVNVDFENNIMLVRYDPIETHALSLDYGGLDRNVELTVTEPVMMVALKDDEIHQVVSLINKILKKRRDNPENMFSMQDYVIVTDGHNTVAVDDGETK